MVFRKNAKKATRVRKFVRKSAMPRKSIAKVVKSTILKMAEVKQSNSSFGMDLVPYANAGWNNTVIPCTPYTGYNEITQDAGQGSRIGNVITVKKLWLSGILFPKPYSVSTNVKPMPLEVKFIFYRLKSSPVSLTSGLEGIFQQGGVDDDIQGHLTDIVMPFNKDKYTILKTKTFKLGFSTYGGSGGAVISQYYANNDFKYNQKFNIDLTKICPKKIFYNDNTPNPSSNIVQLAMIYALADGTTSITSQVPASTWLSLNISYTDM